MLKQSHIFGFNIHELQTKIFSIVCANSSNLTIPISCKHLNHCYILFAFVSCIQGIKVFPLSTFLLKKIADKGLSYAARWFRKVSSKDSTILT